MDYFLDLLRLSGPLDYFFAQHLQHVVEPAFPNSRILSQKDFDKEFDYVCSVLTDYYRGRVHVSRAAELVVEYHEKDLPVREKIVAAELILLMCGFFRRQSRYRGRNTYPLGYYATMAQRFYLEVCNIFPSRSYGRVSDHFRHWTDALDLLAKRFEEQSLSPYLIHVNQDQQKGP